MRRDLLGLRDADECVLYEFGSEQGKRQYCRVSMYI